MAVDLTKLANIANTANALASIVLVNPQEDAGIKPNNYADKKFLFDFNGEETVTLSTDITDHFVEDNSAIQDQAALRPERVTTFGYIGELTDIAPPLLEPAKFIADKLFALAPYEPELAAQSLIAYNNAKFAYDTGINVAKSAVSAWSTINNLGQVAGEDLPQFIQTKQQVAFTTFYAYWRQRTLFQVQTPWAIFTDMMIENLRAVQGEETDKFTTFEITFKKMRFVKTGLITGPLNTQGRLQAQSFSAVDSGVQSPPSSTPLLDGITGAGYE